MAPPPVGRKYDQPYSSRHVINNTCDSARNEEPIYIRHFPRFLHALYRRQTPVNSNLTLNPRSPSPLYEQKSKSRRSLASQSPDRASTPGRVVQQQGNFKTLGQGTTKSPSPISTVPSDFEHIFHYSETQ